MSKRRKPCPKGCKSFCKLAVGKYFQYCGPIAQARRARGEPVSAYKKVGGPKTVRGKKYSGGAVEMLTKDRGWGPAKRSGGMSAPYYAVKGCPCVRQVGREFAMRYAEARAKFKMGAKRTRKVA